MAKSSVPSVRSRALNVQAVVGWYREAIARVVSDPRTPPLLRGDCVVQLELVDTFRQQVATFQGHLWTPPEPLPIAE